MASKAPRPAPRPKRVSSFTKGRRIWESVKKYENRYDDVKSRYYEVVDAINAVNKQLENLRAQKKELKAELDRLEKICAISYNKSEFAFSRGNTIGDYYPPIRSTVGKRTRRKYL